MSEAFWEISAVTSALAGFSALSLAMDRHWEDVFGRNQEPGQWRRWLQTLGTLALLLSLGSCLALQGAAVGWVLWVGVLTMTGKTVILLMTYYPHHSRIVLSGSCLSMLAFGMSGIRAFFA